jgi:hypothetical protein
MLSRIDTWPSTEKRHMDTATEGQDPLTQLREAALRQRLADLANEYGLTSIEDLWDLEASLLGRGARFSVSEHQIAAYRKRLGLPQLREAENPMQPRLDL